MTCSLCIAPTAPNPPEPPDHPVPSVNSHFTALRPTGQREQQIRTPAFDALYLHVPFCFHKCHYCDFYSVVNSNRTDASRQAEFTDALLRELRWWADRSGGALRPRTIFVGGGTPTLLRIPHWQRLLDALRAHGIMDSVTEFTVEANPETVTPDLMHTLHAGGVNRISIGAQSFNPDMLRTLQRWHDPASVPRAVATVRAAGIDHINLDLIFAIPGQTPDLFDADLDAALALHPTHLSCYALTFEPNTPLGKRHELGRITPMAEGLDAAMYAHAMQRLGGEGGKGGEGYEHYEVSAWCRPGRQCQHNLTYWQGGNWLGLGPSAASGLGNRRWKNRGHLSAYAHASPNPPRSEDDTLDHHARIAERLMLGLRLRNGLDRSWFDAIAPIGSDRHASLEAMIDLGFIHRDAHRVRLTTRGLMVADGVVGQLL